MTFFCPRCKDEWSDGYGPSYGTAVAQKHHTEIETCLLTLNRTAADLSARNAMLSDEITFYRTTLRDCVRLYTLPKGDRA